MFVRPLCRVPFGRMAQSLILSLMPEFVSRELSGWGRFPVCNCQVTRPEKRRELLDATQSRAVVDIIARGLGRSYGDAAINQGSGVITAAKLDRFLGFDSQTGVLHAEGGASFADIVETFVPRGFFLNVAPGTKYVTLGGAIACDVHGKNHHRVGAISNFIEEIELLVASGKILICSRDENAEVFWATLGGMGLTGIIVSAKMCLMPIESAWIETKYTRTANLSDTLAAFEKGADAEYSVAWIDCLSTGTDLGRSVVIEGAHASGERALQEIKGDVMALEIPKKKGVPIDLPNFLLNPWTVKKFNDLYYANHPTETKLTSLETFFYPLDKIENWNKIYGSRGFVQYQCVVPLDNAEATLTELLETIASSGQVAFLAVLKRMGKADNAPLGFAMDGYCLALDIPMTPDTLDFYQQLNEITVTAGGRVYLAKDAATSPAQFRQMYPRLGELEKVKRHLDPDDRFASSLSRRLEIGEA